jgi:NAD(P)H-hydrate epimerase
VPVVAVDIPSGIEASSGKILDAAICADLTVTFGLPKVGLLIHPGRSYTGKLEIVDISIPDFLVQEEHIFVELIEQSDVSRILRPRSVDAHKGNHGHLLILAGSRGKTGAAAMAAEAALRSGAGLITLGIPSSLNAIMEAKLTEVMTEPLEETTAQTMSVGSWPRIQELMEGKKAVALGPGISAEPETIKLVQHIVSNSSIPLIIDADGINALAENCALLKDASAPIVITPHPGEMARLLKSSVQSIQEDRIGIAERFAAEYGLYVVLKGSQTIIAEPGGDVCINPTGNPGLASGGTGDVLTGMIAGFAAQGYSLADACRVGVYLHGHIADVLAEETGEIGLTATDLLAEIPVTLKELMLANGIAR